MARLARELIVPELVSKPVIVSVRSSLEKISPPLFVAAEVRLSLELPRIFPKFVRDLLAVICASLSANISPLVWLMISSASIFTAPLIDLIELELVRLLAVICCS